MGAPRHTHVSRTFAAAIASGVAISLTALTAGLSPALADPAGPGGPAGPPTPTVVTPVPPVVAEAPAREAPVREAPAPVVPVVPTAPEPATPPTVEAPAAAPAAPAPERQAQPSVAAPAPKPAPVESPAATPSAPAPQPAAPSPAVAPSEEPGPSSEPTPSAQRKPAPRPEAQAVPTPELATPTTELATPAPESATPPAPAPGLVAPNAEPAAPAPRDDSNVEGPRAGGPERAAVSPTPSAPDQPAVATVIKTEVPKTLVAPKEDVDVALSAKAVEQTPPPATKQDVDAFASVVRSSADARPGNGPRDNDGPFGVSNWNNNRDNDFDRDRDRDWDRDHRVRQWDPRWVSYDDYYRPVISNPYRQPVRIVYVYQNTPRIVIINPLARVVLEVAQYAAYSFTAVVANTVNQAVNVAVGSFFGGGYYPGYGAPYPPPPPPVLRYDNVPVQVRYPQATYAPFRVQRIVDVGDDTRYGERKVLLDGVTPAWGQWTQTPTGERQFEVHKTQQYPGLDEPAAGPLPGDYQLRLASDESSSGMDSKTTYLVVVAAVLSVMSLGAVAWSVLLGRRRRLQD